MAELIHESYRSLFKEMQAENCLGAKPNMVEAFLPAPIYFPHSLEKRAISGKVCGLIGVVIGAVFALGGHHIFSNTEKIASTATVVPATSPSILPDEAKALRADMELTKKILAGLVKSVQTLSIEAVPKLQSSSNLNEFPYPIQVLTEKANLREQPGMAQRAVVTVPKDTVLLAMEERDGWLKVSTPKGEDAWISLDIVQRKG